ncbi:uncharacterized protein LOC119278672 isoform X2 [Triticum dicoccoides]|uniref:uncharacterized protein LOC119278672 isoform X2 n=1 Tax=Triticum dicoccoides TaxID=85692 RepID=UPI0018909969|nr:uncharacterized protein LOC119278672 isoform X2 [Triticum dicoccoides]
MASASGAARTCIFSSDMDGSIQTLVPYGESDEEVDLPDNDIAFCLRSIFATPGAPGSTAGGMSISTAPHVAAYARELEKKLERKEIDANDVGEDPLGVAARKDKATAWIRIQAQATLQTTTRPGCLARRAESKIQVQARQHFCPGISLRTATKLLSNDSVTPWSEHVMAYSTLHMVYDT